MDADAPGPGPRAVFNALLASIVQHLLDHTAHADFFRGPVSRVVITDYDDFVPTSQEMYLGRMLQRAHDSGYTSFEEFLSDLKLIRANAAAYNGRGGGRHAYEPVIHWAADLEATAIQQATVHAATLSELEASMAQEPQSGEAVKTATDSSALAAVVPPPQQPAAPTAAPPAGPASAAAPAIELAAVAAALALPPSEPTQQEAAQPRALKLQVDVGTGPGDVGAMGSGAQGGSSTNRGDASPADKPTSSPCCGSGGSGDDGAGRSAHCHSGLDVLLAACEMAAGQDAARPPPAGASGAGDSQCVPAAGGAGAATCQTSEREAGSALPTLCGLAPERMSHPGSNAVAAIAATQTPGKLKQAGLEAAAGSAAAASAAPAGQLQLPLQSLPEEPAGSSEDGGMALCSARGAGPAGAAADSGGPAGRSGSAAGGASGAGGGPLAGRQSGSSYLTSNAFKNRRHKSKVYVKPSKVVYLPTAFVEEQFDVSTLPLDCEMAVEADGADTGERFQVTIKAVPRSGLSTMYCITNVMAFQQRYLHWQIFNWTCVDATHIKIHLQSPSTNQAQQPRAEMDRAGSFPEDRDMPLRTSEDGGGAGAPGWGAFGPGSLKRKSDHGRYGYGIPPGRLERGAGLLALHDSGLYEDLRHSANGALRRTSPTPESPPVSPQRRHSNGYTHQSQHPHQQHPHALRLPAGWPPSLPPQPRLHRLPPGAGGVHPLHGHALPPMYPPPFGLPLARHPHFPGAGAAGGSGGGSSGFPPRRESQSGGTAAGAFPGELPGFGGLAAAGAGGSVPRLQLPSHAMGGALSGAGPLSPVQFAEHDGRDQAASQLGSLGPGLGSLGSGLQGLDPATLQEALVLMLQQQQAPGQGQAQGLPPHLLTRQLDPLAAAAGGIAREEQRQPFPSRRTAAPGRLHADDDEGLDDGYTPFAVPDAAISALGRGRAAPQPGQLAPTWQAVKQEGGLCGRPQQLVGPLLGVEGRRAAGGTAGSDGGSGVAGGSAGGSRQSNSSIVSAGSRDVRDGGSGGGASFGGAPVEARVPAFAGGRALSGAGAHDRDQGYSDLLSPMKRQRIAAVESAQLRAASGDGGMGGKLNLSGADLDLLQKAMGIGAGAGPLADALFAALRAGAGAGAGAGLQL